MDAIESQPPGDDRRWRRRAKREVEIVLVCNPRSGGRWKELAAILDSDEAAHVRRIVTDSVEDIAPALSKIGRDARLLCIYGGDGTIQRILDRLEPGKEEATLLALLGGGTMNVTSRWLGFGRSPGRNFRYVVNGYRRGDLLLREVPLMHIRVGSRVHRGFTFGMGPIVRILDVYERGPKGKRAAVRLGVQSVAGACFKRGALAEILGDMPAQVTLDGERLPYARYSALFANITGQINPGVEPFKEERTRETFYTAAYAVSPREMALALPFIARGLLPLDLQKLIFPGRRDREAPALPTDPRYVNRPVSRLEIETDEELYTVDGELFRKDGGSIEVTIGPTLKLVVGPKAALSQSLRAARTVIRG